MMDDALYHTSHYNNVKINLLNLVVKVTELHWLTYVLKT